MADFKNGKEICFYLEEKLHIKFKFPEPEVVLSKQQ